MPKSNDPIPLGDFLGTVSQTYKRVAIAITVVAGYFLIGKIGLRLAIVHPSATAIWAPSGISLAACILFGLWVWPAVFVGAFLVNITTYGSVATTLTIALGNTLEALVGGYLVWRFAGGKRTFDRAANTFRFVFLAAILSTTISATIGVTSLAVSGYASWSEYERIWLTWWLGDATGDLIVAPLLILWGSNARLGYDKRKSVEAVTLVCALLLIAGLVLDGILQIWALPVPYVFVCTPVLLWSAFRFGRRETATAALILSIIAIVGTVSGPGPSPQAGKNEILLLVQVFVGVILTSLLIVAVELDERRRMDEARWRLAALIRSSDDAIVGLTAKGQITSWNPAAERMYGFSDTEAIGQPVSMIIPPDRIDEAAEILAQVNRDAAIAPFETVRLRKNGERIGVSLSVSPIKDDDGRIIGASKIARDITQLQNARIEREALLRSEREARKSAEGANRAKDEFLAMLGHELRNPLYAISLALRLLDSPDSVDQVRDLMARQMAQLSRLVDDLTDAARVTSGKMILRRHPINLAELVAECLSSLREMQQLNGHRLETKLDTVWVDGDSDRLVQIVTNLVSNAVKYTSPGGEIRVRVRALKNATIEVQDDGRGIDSELLPRVFDLFARGVSGLDGSPGGLGIGLTLVKQIAELHGGKVAAASDGPGFGSTFRVELPRISAQTYRPEHSVKPTNAIGPSRILIIEDNEDTRKPLRRLLETSGHRVYEASDGPDGAKKAVEIRPDVAVVDVGLPGFDGYEVASRIRSSRGCRHTTLIALTGYGQSEYRKKGRLAGFHHYLVKPVDFDELGKLITNSRLRQISRSPQQPSQ